MRILYLSQLIPYPIDAGPKRRIYHVLEYLSGAGHEITLAAFSRPDDSAEALEHIGRFCTAVHTVPMVRSRTRDSYHLLRSLGSGTPFLIARDSIPAMHQLIESLVSHQTFDAIHADQLWMAQYTLRAAELMETSGPRPQLILDEHNATYLIPERLARGNSSGLTRTILLREASAMRRYEIDTCRQFDHVVWVTAEDQQAVTQVAAEAGVSLPPSTVIPIAIDPTHQLPIQRTEQPFRVTFMGGLHWPPNSEGISWFVNEVWPIIHSQWPDAVLTVIGRDPPRELVQAQSSLDNLDVVGYVVDPSPLLAETAVFIVPLFAGGGMRVKILDAWAWGLPIVSTTVGAEGVAYRDGENLIIANEVPAFAEAVGHVLDEPGLGNRLAIDGRRTAEECYDWRTVYRVWSQIYP